MNASGWQVGTSYRAYLVQVSAVNCMIISFADNGAHVIRHQMHAGDSEYLCGFVAAP